MHYNLFNSKAFSIMIINYVMQFTLRKWILKAIAYKLHKLFA